jgi:uncharacterized protein
MAVQSFVKWLLPREDKFFDFMEKQAVIAHRAALAISAFKAGGKSAEDVAKEVQDIEHEGDAILHGVEDALARTFVTPIDREDIQQLASRLDDVTDKINLTARSFALYGMDEPTAAMLTMMRILVDATAILKEAMPLLRADSHAAIIEATRKVKTLEKEGDTVFRNAVAQLFRDPAVDAKMLLRTKEGLEDLEEAVDTCEDTAEFLAHLAIKHG